MGKAQFTSFTHLQNRFLRRVNNVQDRRTSKIEIVEEMFNGEKQPAIPFPLSPFRGLLQIIPCFAKTKKESLINTRASNPILSLKLKRRSSQFREKRNKGSKNEMKVEKENSTSKENLSALESKTRDIGKKPTFQNLTADVRLSTLSARVKSCEKKQDVNDDKESKQNRIHMYVEELRRELKKAIEQMLEAEKQHYIYKQRSVPKYISQKRPIKSLSSNRSQTLNLNVLQFDAKNRDSKEYENELICDGNNFNENKLGPKMNKVAKYLKEINQDLIKTLDEVIDSEVCADTKKSNTKIDKNQPRLNNKVVPNNFDEQKKFAPLDSKYPNFLGCHKEDTVTHSAISQSERISIRSLPDDKLCEQKSLPGENKLINFTLRSNIEGNQNEIESQNKCGKGEILSVVSKSNPEEHMVWYTICPRTISQSNLKDTIDSVSPPSRPQSLRKELTRSQSLPTISNPKQKNFYDLEGIIPQSVKPTQFAKKDQNPEPTPYSDTGNTGLNSQYFGSNIKTFQCKSIGLGSQFNHQMAATDIQIPSWMINTPPRASRKYNFQQSTFAQSAMIIPPSSRTGQDYAQLNPPKTTSAGVFASRNLGQQNPTSIPTIISSNVSQNCGLQILPFITTISNSSKPVCPFSSFPAAAENVYNNFPSKIQYSPQIQFNSTHSHPVSEPWHLPQKTNVFTFKDYAPRSNSTTSCYMPQQQTTVAAFQQFQSQTEVAQKHFSEPFNEHFQKIVTSFNNQPCLMGARASENFMSSQHGMAAHVPNPVYYVSMIRYRQPHQLYDPYRVVPQSANSQTESAVKGNQNYFCVPMQQNQFVNHTPAGSTHNRNTPH